MAKIITETPIEEFIKRFRSNAEHQRKIGDLHGCLEFRQLADTLEKYQKIEQIQIDSVNETTVDNGDLGKIKINYCPMCGRSLKDSETK